MHVTTVAEASLAGTSQP